MSEENINFSINNLTSSIWAEKVIILTKEFEIKGHIFMPKTAKKSRVLTDILNSSKRFIAVKDCEISNRNTTVKRNEFHNFVQVNINEIILLRPIGEKD